MTRALVATAALVASLVAVPIAFLFGALGLIIAEALVLAVAFPVGFAMEGLVAALAGAWAANFASRDGTRAPLLLTLARGLLVGALGGVAFVTLYLAQGGFADGPPGPILVPVAILVAAAAALLGLPLRRAPVATRRRDILVSLAALVLLPIAWYGIVGLACAADMCGA